MDGAYHIPDASDWLETPLKDLATLENLLHCQICKEFYDTPMITSCCHTFCSKCIRTSLSADGKCPACRTADQASKLRNNWALQELVAAFNDARPAALEVARKKQEAAAQSRRPGKRKRVVLSPEDEVRTTRSKSRRIAASQGSQPEVVEVDDSEADETFEPDEPEEPEVDDGLIECPLGCGKRMKIEAVEPHLDKCEDEKKQTSRQKSRTPLNGFGTPASIRPKQSERLPELSYSLFNDAKLSKKLKELGIPNGGSKQLMIKRHKEWVNIWNANCDSNQPRTKRELLQELDSWERTQGGRAPNANGLASTIMRKDFDAAGWANSNKSDFSRLIADARRKKNNPAIEPDKPKPDALDGTNETAEEAPIQDDPKLATITDGDAHWSRDTAMPQPSPERDRQSGGDSLSARKGDTVLDHRGVPAVACERGDDFSWLYNANQNEDMSAPAASSSTMPPQRAIDPREALSGISAGSAVSPRLSQRDADRIEELVVNGGTERA